MSPSQKKRRTITSDPRPAAAVKRLGDLRARLHQERLDAFITTSLAHVRYLSAFTGSNALCVVTPDRALIVTDTRYKDQVREETQGFAALVAKGQLLDELPATSILKEARRIGFEHALLPVAHHSRLAKLFPRKKFVGTDGIVESLACVKDATEIALLRAAAAITDAVFGEILSLLRPGVTESELAAELSYRQRRRGAEGDAFEPIVASGIHGALPHARASDKRLARGELVVLDFGCRVQGYHSDLTRTVAIGKPSAELRKMYRTVLEAQARALDECRVPMRARELDAVARAHIRRAGLGKYFSHSLGHGLGLQIHEDPKLSAKSSSMLVAGNVVTIEPGVYVPGIGGVRIEDDVVLGTRGHEILTRSPKELTIL